uniref:Uncharacterized protein n=1 Tax=Utricularia reniformis TaxID=192314 RepID=A0A1Y0B4S6_9LAMI|nr:hypothetical protein AEK19_MT2267 [Utricularia reniformis]ART32412.1 hypothetical protein AEK19_MT2267 [Utricularia reniformis]
MCSFDRILRFPLKWSTDKPAVEHLGSHFPKKFVEKFNMPPSLHPSSQPFESTSFWNSKIFGYLSS